MNSMGPQFDYCLRATNNPSYFAVTTEENPGGLEEEAVSRDEVDTCARSAPARVCAWPDGSRSLQRRPRPRQQPDSPRRRDFRALLRSLSAREGGFEDNRGFLQGKPRPGDVAPTETNTLPLHITSGRISSSVVSSEGTKEREEIFYTIPQGRRRHSVGSYLTAGSGGGAAGAGVATARITAVPSEVPKMPAPRVAPPSPAEASVKRRKQKIFNFKEMEDIAILSSKESPESELWSDYLVTCFDKIMSQRARHHYRVMPVPVEELIGKSTPEQIQKIAKAQLQIVIICPKLAEKMSALKQETASVDNVFKTDKVLVMLLGVEKNDIITNNSTDFPTIEQWPMMEVKEKDTTFVDNFLTSAVGILRTKDCKDTSTDKTSFSIVPKKIKLGQSRVIALLNEPIREEDSIKIMVDKKGEVIQIPAYKRRNPYTLQFDIPDSCLEVSMLIWIRISKNGQSLGRRQIKCESRLRELDQILRANDHPLDFMCQTLGFKMTNREQLDSWMLSAFQKNIPPFFNLLASPEQYNPKGSLQSAEEYPTLLHFAARYGLEKLSWQLLECPGGDAACNLRNVRQLTPAELAHAAGFSHLATVLKGHMQMNEFSNMYYYLKNMTENSKDSDGSGDGTETTTELKIVEAGDVECEKEPSNKSQGHTEQSSTDPFSEECLQNLERSRYKTKKMDLPLINLPVPLEQLYQNDIIFPLTEAEDWMQQAIEHDYLVQPSNIKVEINSPKLRPNNLYVNSTALTSQPTDMFLYSPTEETKSFLIDTPTSDIGQVIAKEHCKSTTGSVKSGRENSYPLTGQEELAEIINDFKNNVFSISEVEKLVMDWRTRNETQQSLKEKQEQLSKMRNEYERLQHRIKENMKRPTPFERVKKMFSKGKPKNNDASSQSIEKRNGCNRPNSSLSESSSSSGRLSTVSGGSVGESSIQSELDEKRVSSTISSNTPSLSSSVTVDIDTKREDYLIPPPPRPLTGGAYPVSMTTFGHPKHHMATIVEKDVLTQSQDKLNSSGTHMRMSFDGVCRSTSMPEGSNGNSGHLYMNVSPSKS